MIGGQWRIVSEDSRWDRRRDLFIGISQARGKPLVVAPFLVLERDEAAALERPTLSETHADVQDNLGDVTGFLQAAMDEAWRIGLRPAGFADTANELKATRYHLEDMRKIAKVPGAT